MYFESFVHSFLPRTANKEIVTKCELRRSVNISLAQMNKTVFKVINSLHLKLILFVPVKVESKMKNEFLDLRRNYKIENGIIKLGVTFNKFKERGLCFSPA